MIQTLSSVIAKWLEEEGVISAEDKNLFLYASYSLLFGLLPIFISAMFGLAFGMLREGLFMVAPLMLIRKFSGGFHLNSSKACVIRSTAMIVLAIVLTKRIACGECLHILNVSVVLSVICLCAFSPVEHGLRKLTKKECRLYHIVVCIIAITSLIMYLVMCNAANIQYAVAFGVGISLTAILQLLGVLAKIREHL